MRFHRPNTNRHRRMISTGLAILAIASSLPLTMATPAQAGWLDAVRGALRGDSGGRASGRSRGGGTRDEVCAINRGSSTAAIATDTDEPEVAPSQLVVLVPDTLQKTTQATPEFYMYVPFDRSHQPLTLVFELATKESETSRQVIAGPMPLSLPNEPGLVRFQLPADLSLATGITYEWTFRLLCQEAKLHPETHSRITFPAVTSETSSIDIDDIEIRALGSDTLIPSGAVPPTPTVRQEVFGTIQRVAPSPDLANALTTSAPSDRHQVYLDYGVWFDMVATLAANQLPDWSVLLTEFQLTDVDQTPQSIVPTSSVVLGIPKAAATAR